VLVAEGVDVAAREAAAVDALEAALVIDRFLRFAERQREGRGRR
jgi:hypothetical protein